MNCGKNVRLKPTKTISAASVGPAFRIHAPGNLRPPEMHAAEVGHQRAAHHDVVEVGDDEVGVGDVDVDAEARQEQSGQAADGEQADEAEGVQHRRRRNEMEPLYRVAVQLKTLMAEGTATR